MWIEKKYSDPWPHIVIDNFYPDDIWEYLTKDRQSLFDQYKDNAVIEPINVNYTSVQDKKLLDFFTSRVSLDYCISNFPNHRDYDTITPWINLKIDRDILDEYMFPIHVDYHTKVFSCITYIEPLHANGTILFDENKNFDRVVAWKPNRAVIFSSVENVTWHTWGAWEKESRYTVDFFWQRDNSKKEGGLGYD